MKSKLELEHWKPFLALKHGLEYLYRQPKRFNSGEDLAKYLNINIRYKEQKIEACYWCDSHISLHCSLKDIQSARKDFLICHEIAHHLCFKTTSTGYGTLSEYWQFEILAEVFASILTGNKRYVIMRSDDGYKKISGKEKQNLLLQIECQLREDILKPYGPLIKKS